MSPSHLIEYHFNLGALFMNNSNTSFYSEYELSKLGFKSYGSNCRISKNSTIYSAEKIILGNNVRIDDFCVLSGKITIGNYVHLAVGASYLQEMRGLNFVIFLPLPHDAVYMQ